MQFRVKPWLTLPIIFTGIRNKTKTEQPSSTQQPDKPNIRPEPEHDVIATDATAGRHKPADANRPANERSAAANPHPNSAGYRLRRATVATEDRARDVTHGRSGADPARGPRGADAGDRARATATISATVIRDTRAAAVCRHGAVWAAAAGECGAAGAEPARHVPTARALATLTVAAALAGAAVPPPPPHVSDAVAPSLAAVAPPLAAVAAASLHAVASAHATIAATFTTVTAADATDELATAVADASVPNASVPDASVADAPVADASISHASVAAATPPAAADAVVAAAHAAVADAVRDVAAALSATAAGSTDESSAADAKQKPSGLYCCIVCRHVVS